VSDDSFRFVVVALAVVSIAVLASGASSGGAVGAPTVQEGTQSAGLEPNVRLTFERHNLTPSNASSFVLYVGNSAESERPMYVMVVLRVHVDDGDFPVVVDEDPGLEVGDTLVWQFDFDLQPGEYRLKYGVIGRNADPGEYDVDVNATYWKEQGFASRTHTDRLVVQPLPNGDGNGSPGEWLEKIVDVLLATIGRPEVIVAVAAVLGLLISIIEGDRTWPAILGLWRWTKSILARITRWAFGDDRQ
jgi:hypothetical protein